MNKYSAAAAAYNNMSNERVECECVWVWDVFRIEIWCVDGSNGGLLLCCGFCSLSLFFFFLLFKYLNWFATIGEQRIRAGFEPKRSISSTYLTSPILVSRQKRSFPSNLFLLQVKKKGAPANPNQPKMPSSINFPLFASLCSKTLHRYRSLLKVSLFLVRQAVSNVVHANQHHQHLHSLTRCVSRNITNYRY